MDLGAARIAAQRHDLRTAEDENGQRFTLCTRCRWLIPALTGWMTLGPCIPVEGP